MVEETSFGKVDVQNFPLSLKSTIWFFKFESSEKGLQFFGVLSVFVLFFIDLFGRRCEIDVDLSEELTGSVPLGPPHLKDLANFIFFYYFGL